MPDFRIVGEVRFSVQIKPEAGKYRALVYENFKRRFLRSSREGKTPALAIDNLLTHIRSVSAGYNDEYKTEMGAAVEKFKTDELPEWGV